MNFKTILACAALLIGIGTATAAVESDIVGYTTITMEAGKWYQVGCPFDGLDETVTPSVATIFNNGFNEGDKVYVYNQSKGSYELPLTWGVPSGGTEATWLNSRNKVADFDLQAGQAVFIRKAQTNTVSVSGKVDAKNVVEFGSESGSTWSQIIYPYPVDKDINEMLWSGLVNGDKLYVYNQTKGSYDLPYTWKDGKWYNNRNKIVAVTIPVGAAMFIQKTDGGVATLSVE